MRFLICKMHHIFRMKPARHLVAYLETAHTDMRRDKAMYIAGRRTGTHHTVYRIFHDAAHSTTPSGMHRTHHTCLLIAKEQRQAVGCIHTYSHSLQCGDHSIDTINITAIDRHTVNHRHTRAVCLSWHHNHISGYTET